MRRPRLGTALAGLAIVSTMGLSAAPAMASAPTAGAVSQAAASHSPRATASAPINQTIAGVGTFAGQFTPTKFTASNGHLNVTGTVTGTLTSLTGQVTQVNQTVTTTVNSATNAVTGAATTAAAAAASCSILSLQLGPLHLDLLGLVIDLNQVNLNITAVPGAGNLLGNLLCSIAGLLDGSGLNGLAALLNQLLGLLG